jgi:hypothetical protein
VEGSMSTVTYFIKVYSFRAVYCGPFICATFLLHFRYNETAEARNHSHNVRSLFVSLHSQNVSLCSLTKYVFLHSHCTCPYVHCTHRTSSLCLSASLTDSVNTRGEYLLPSRTRGVDSRTRDVVSQ